MASLNDEVRQLSRAIEKLSGNVGGGRGGSAGGGSGGGSTSITGRATAGLKSVAGGKALGGGLAGLGAQAGLAVASGAAALTGAGLVNANRGGSFSGGVATAANAALAKVPFVGELSGAAPTARIQEGARGGLDALTNKVAQFGGAGAINEGLRGFLGAQQIEQQKNVEADRQKNAAFVADNFDRAAEGQGGIAGILGEILAELRRGGNGSGGGAGRHT